MKSPQPSPPLEFNERGFEANTGSPEHGDRFHVPEVPKGIMTAEEVNAWAAENEYGNNKRGTLNNGESYLYVKHCHRIDTEEDVEPALEAVRYMNSKGMLHPATQWGAFRYDDGSYQLFAVSPKLHALSFDDMEGKEFKRVSRPYTDETSAKLEWVRRLDPTATVATVDVPKPARKTLPASIFLDDFLDFEPSYKKDEVQSPEPLMRLLNLPEAIHPDNWGWDDEGTIYPVDVEVIRVNGNIDIIRERYTQQHPDSTTTVAAPDAE